MAELSQELPEGDGGWFHYEVLDAFEIVVGSPDGVETDLVSEDFQRLDWLDQRFVVIYWNSPFLESFQDPVAEVLGFLLGLGPSHYIIKIITDVLNPLADLRLHESLEQRWALTDALGKYAPSVVSPSGDIESEKFPGLDIRCAHEPVAVGHVHLESPFVLGVVSADVFRSRSGELVRFRESIDRRLEVVCEAPAVSLLYKVYGRAKERLAFAWFD
ncbi:hypothetical protein HDU81_010011 [Chytriomyces hyalinus]|nr:hypothetical protein HDU81_010011 [Chytriomyces hyalinus]